MVQECTHVFIICLRISSTDHGDTTTHRIRHHPIYLAVDYELKIPRSLREHGIARGLKSADILGMVEFVVALLLHQQFGLVIAPSVGIDRVFGWFHADRAKLFERISQEQHITVK